MALQGWIETKLGGRMRYARRWAEGFEFSDLTGTRYQAITYAQLRRARRRGEWLEMEAEVEMVMGFLASAPRGQWYKLSRPTDRQARWVRGQVQAYEMVPTEPPGALAKL